MREDLNYSNTKLYRVEVSDLSSSLYLSLNPWNVLHNIKLTHTHILSISFQKQLSPPWAQSPEFFSLSYNQRKDALMLTVDWFVYFYKSFGSNFSYTDYVYRIINKIKESPQVIRSLSSPFKSS